MRNFSELAPHSFLKLTNIRVLIHLGVTAEERFVPQPVHLNIQIRFPTPPRGCLTDQISDTVCYATIYKKIQAFCESSEFNLIEKLTWDVHSLLKNHLPSDHLLSTSVTKSKLPPLDYCENASFCVQDWGHD